MKTLLIHNQCVGNPSTANKGFKVLRCVNEVVNYNDSISLLGTRAQLGIDLYFSNILKYYYQIDN